MKVKKCVGPILYDDSGKIFLMTSPKWKGWLVSGGKIEEGESYEEALRREIREELSIEITDLVFVGEKVKKKGESFYDKEVEFHFIDYFARALSIDIIPNKEISEWGWFSISEALELDLVDSTREFVLKFKKWKGNNK